MFEVRYCCIGVMGLVDLRCLRSSCVCWTNWAHKASKSFSLCLALSLISESTYSELPWYCGDEFSEDDNPLLAMTRRCIGCGCDRDLVRFRFLFCCSCCVELFDLSWWLPPLTRGGREFGFLPICMWSKRSLSKSNMPICFCSIEIFLGLSNIFHLFS